MENKELLDFRSKEDARRLALRVAVETRSDSTSQPNIILESAQRYYDWLTEIN